MPPSTLAPALLAFTIAVGCTTAVPSPPTSPVPAAAKVDDARLRAEFDATDVVFRRGLVEAALKRWRAMPEYPPAVARVALFENRPEAVLALPVGDQPPLLKAQALAAMMLGDVAAAARILPPLRTAAGAEENAAALGAWLAAARLAGVPRVSRVTEGAPAAASLDIKDGLPVIAVRVGARTERFLFDTGADGMFVDSSAADRLGVRRAPDAVLPGRSAAGAVRASVGLLPRIEVLGLTLEDEPVAVAELGPSLMNLQIAGVLGVQRLFRRDVVILDYAAARVERSRQSRAEGWPMVFLAGRAISVEGRLDGGLEGLFQIDTGVAEPMVTSKYLELSLAVHPPWYVGPVQPKSFFGLGGIKAGAARPVEGSRFCARGEGACLDLPRVFAWDALANVIQGLNGVEHAGIFGGSAFRGRVLELDYPALRVRVRPSM